jgi:hypothetical protein
MDTPPGLREGGMAWQSLVSDTELHAITVLDWRDTTAVAHGGSGTVVHTVSLTGTPAGACATCRLELVAGDPVAGVETIASGGGYRYVPALGSASVQICAE